MIAIQNLSRTYTVGDESVEALKNVELKIPKGELTVIVGPSGSGKSTLLHIIGGLDRPTSGTVEVDGEEIHELSDRKLSNYRNSHVGFVFQDFKLHPHLTILENLKIPLLFHPKRVKDSTAKKRAREMLKIFKLEQREKHRPHEISGGQKQRVAIARALMNNPKILLADEPTGNLDSVTGEKIVKLLVKIQSVKKMTMVIVTHDKAIARYASNIIQIKDGKIVHKNGHKKFLN
ncbi:MAG TPA: ABC transporter ATP-binding protein [Candidatus Gracilibacteria bacterium]|nr:ABC transporter ATP-binding protein [Candidatus Gracilibacteria bacterium]